jgi:hypothetical protein
VALLVLGMIGLLATAARRRGVRADNHISRDVVQ